jgi:hypothetical protein
MPRNSMMASTAARAPIHIEQMGEKARAWLGTGLHGEVLASVSNAIYLRSDTDEVLWVAAGKAPMHQRCLQTAAPLPSLMPGTPFHVQHQTLQIGTNVNFDFATAAVWRPAPIPARDVLERREIWARLSHLVSLEQLSQARGFGTFIPEILDLHRTGAIATRLVPTNPILATAQPIVLDTLRACVENRVLLVPYLAAALIGLGPGLTPSGDDFVGGLLFTLQVLRTVYPHAYPLANAFVLESFRGWTHPISFALLQDLAAGCTIAPLHQIIHGILCGESLQTIQVSVSRLLQVGHSTGWDLLAGVLAGLLTVADSSHEAVRVQEPLSLPA